MKKQRQIVLLFLTSIFTVGCSQIKSEEVIFADPTIFVEEGKYYLTGTRNWDPRGFGILESTDLEEWRTPNGDSLQLILKKNHSVFGSKGFWAPQILKDGDEYLLTYTADEQTVLTKSNSLLGLFTQKKIEPIDGSEKNIDSFIFTDDNGKSYLYHVRFNKGNYIWVAEFDKSRGKIDNTTLKRCFDASQDWERTVNYKSVPIMEGPTVFKRDGLYYMIYSANHFRNIDYAVGYATAPTPMGPWKKSENNPIIHRSIVGENGSGHGDMFEGVDGEYYYVYHVHATDSTVIPRKTRVVPLVFSETENGVYDISVDATRVIKAKQIVTE